MKLNDLNIYEKSHYYKDSDIFNLKSPKTPEKYKSKPISLNIEQIDDTNNYQTIFNNDRYYLNKKDHINECLRYKKWMKSYIDRYKKYKTVENLREESKKIQMDKSYDFNYEQNNILYKNIRQKHRNGTVSLGNSTTNFRSEYSRMQDFANKYMLKKKLEKDKSDILNKSMDIPYKFKPLKRINFKRRSHINELFTPNSIDLDINKSTDNIKLKKNKNTLDFYKSNIFFDKEKEKSNEKLNKYSLANKAKRKYEKIKNQKLRNKKSHPNIIRKKQNYFFEERPKKQPKNAEELKQFFRDGNFPLPYANYKPLKEIKISSIDDIYNSRNKKLYNGLTEKERNSDKYIVLGITNNLKFDPIEVKNIFAKNGIHMFGEQTYSSYIENGKKGKFIFNIRKDLKDPNYNEKLEKIKNILSKKQGIEFNIDNRKIIYNKKIRKDITPTKIQKKEKEEDKIFL